MTRIKTDEDYVVVVEEDSEGEPSVLAETGADSMAWSARGRRMQLPGCHGRHANEANCLRWALTWREAQIGGLAQLSLGVAA